MAEPAPTPETRERVEESLDYLVHEWEYGGYEREISLPDGFGSGVEASLANGQLAIRVLRGEPEGSLTVRPRHAD